MPHFASPHLAMPGLGQGSGPGDWARVESELKFGEDKVCIAPGMNLSFVIRQFSFVADFFQSISDN